MKITGHVFAPGTAGHSTIYCQAPADPGTSPVPGYPHTTCGYLESAHIMTPAQQAEGDAELVDRLIREIGGWAA